MRLLTRLMKTKSKYLLKNSNDFCYFLFFLLYYIYQNKIKGKYMIGFLNVYKPEGLTSNAVVQMIKKHFHLKKVGHMGTLDPMAKGLLPIAIGKATRMFDYLLEKKKTYNVIFDFGYETDTLDITGTKINENNVEISEEDLKKNISKMIGKQNQMPPKFSAKNVDGNRAYDLARKGIEFELKPKEIEIFNFKMINEIESNRFLFQIVCSSGTYIRAIGRDLAKFFETYATMSMLERCDLGFFNLDNSFKLDEILSSDNIDNFLLSPIDILPFYKRIDINKLTYKNLIDGKFVAFEKFDTNAFVFNDGRLIGIAKPRENQLKIDCYLEENYD